MTKKSLIDLVPGETARIEHLSGSKPLIRRLISLGVTPGSQVLFVRRAPLGDPLQVSVAGCQLSIRASEAQQVKVNPN